MGVQAMEFVLFHVEAHGQGDPRIAGQDRIGRRLGYRSPLACRQTQEQK